MRILVTVSPLTHREELALAIHGHRPDFEVLLSAPESPGRQAESFTPHLQVRNDDVAGLWSGVLYRVGVSYDGGGMHVRFGCDEEVGEIRNAGVDDLLEVLDRTTRLMPQGTVG